MNQDYSNNTKMSTEEKLSVIDKRHKRAALLAVGVGLLAWIVTISIYGGLKSIHPKSTTIDVILLFWNVVMVGAPLIGVWVYKKYK